MFRRHSRIVTGAALCFFTWTSGGAFSLAAAAQLESKTPKATASLPMSVEERFSLVLGEMEASLTDAKIDIVSKKARLKAGIDEIDKIDAEMRVQFAATEQKLKATKLPAVILERHARFVKHYNDNLSELKENVARVSKATTEFEVKAESEKAYSHLMRIKAPSQHQKVDSNNLTHRQPKPVKREPRLTKEEFDRDLKKDKHAWEKQKRIMVASAGSLIGLMNNTIAQPATDDLAETVDINFTPEIRAKAQELGNNPARIFEWVRNNIEFIPTWGSVQGAQMTLLTQQGNAFDTASLLLALLRVSGISAHYVSGTIELPIDKVKSWAGGFTDPQAAGNYFSSGGTPGKGIIEYGSTFTKVQLEHVWVEAYLPYGNYRGTMRDKSEPRWIPLDASYKLHSFVSPMGINATLPFDQDSYLSSINGQNPLQYYQAQIQTYFDTNAPDKTVVDAKAKKSIIEESFKFLPSSLPYKTVAILNKSSDLTANAHNSVTIKLTTTDDTSDFSYTATTAELAGNRVTLSYRPATADDEAVVASYGGTMYDVPAYLIQVKPELMVGGVVVNTGTPTTIGNNQTITLDIHRLGVAGETTQKTIVAGGYYDIGLNPAGYNAGNMGNRNGTFLTKMATLPSEAFTKDDLIGEHLHQLAMAYFYANDTLYSSSAKLYNIAQFRHVSGCFVSIFPKVAYLNAIPQKVTLSGVEMDMRLERITAIARDGNLQTEKAYMELAGLVSSFDEHNTFEAIEGVASVSTVKALQFANQNGIPVYTITSANLSQVVPQLQIGDKDLTDITTAVNAGKEVTISKKNVQINDWNGLGYIVRDPANGSGTYVISGGLSGGISCINSSAYYSQIYKGPYPGIKNTLDLQTQRTIAFAATAEEGEDLGDMNEIGAAAQRLLEDQDSDPAKAYKAVGTCSGLVKLAYKAAGISLDELVAKAGVVGPNGVAFHYHLAEYLGKLRKDNNPLIGDIVFFSNTSGPGHPLNHEGIVIFGPDDDGTVTYIDATRSGGVSEKLINVSRPNDPEFNSYVSRSKTNNLAGQLFEGFGTIRKELFNHE